MIFLAILIILCFLALIYGFYIKIAKKEINLETNNITYNLNLEDGHEIIDIDLIENKKLLFTIKYNKRIYAIIYDVNTKMITKIENTNE